ncbi:MAG: RHS repeat-associated core domain-containing protein [Paludibacteraceae bacterium]|nr:RHS repeat-associated core domain-containing protein [Paludibacteraceae bacterium]
MTEYITVYIKELNQLYRTGLTTEHSFRPALQQLLQACTGFTVINEQSHIDCDAPDLTLLSKLLPIAYVEAKDLEDGDLDGRKKNKEQFSRYKESLDTIIFTDYLDFHLYEHGEWKQSVSLAEIQNAQSYLEHLSAKYPFGEITDPNVDNVDAADKYPTELQYDCLPFQLAGLSLSGNKDIFYRCITTYYHPSGYAEDVYYTHSNHLGSASWITDVHGDPIQYIHYAPYGELLASQHAYGSSYDERYKFTGKERDAESGYDYYGARYQIVPLGIWGSPDPLLDKTIHMSSYMYCNGNPIKFIDPDGRIILFAPGVSESFKSDFKQAVSYMKQNGISGMLIQLMTSPNVYFLSEGIESNSNEFNPNTKTITWNSRLGIITDNLYEMSPVEALNHEIDHAWGYETNPVQQKMLGKIEDPNYGNLEEKRVIMGSEQETAQKLGKLKPGEVTRNNHNGSAYETTSPISTESKWSCTPSEE